LGDVQSGSFSQKAILARSPSSLLVHKPQSLRDARRRSVWAMRSQWSNAAMAGRRVHLCHQFRARTARIRSRCTISVSRLQPTHVPRWADHASVRAMALLFADVSVPSAREGDRPWRIALRPDCNRPAAVSFNDWSTGDRVVQRSFKSGWVELLEGARTMH